MKSRRPTLSVSRTDLQRGIRTVTKGLQPRLPIEIRIDSADGNVSMFGPGASVTFDGNGYWPGSAFVQGALLKKLGLCLPAGDAIQLEFKDGLVIGNVRLTARWQDISPEPAVIPLDASLGEILAVEVEQPD